MPLVFGDKRIRVRLAAILDGDTGFAPVERRELAFAGYIRNLVHILEQSPTGRLLMRAAVIADVSVGLDPLLEPNSSFFYPAQNHFDLGYQPDLLQKTEKGVSRYLVSFIGALRRVWHAQAGHAPDVALKPEDFLKLCRCEEADVNAIIHLTAWELRSGGAAFLWRHLLSGADGDISVVFERAMLEDPQAQFDGRALKSAFNQWFAERERTAACDHMALEIIDMALVQRRSLVGRRGMRRDSIQDIGILPSGQNYLSGCLFTSAWYDGLDDDANRMHLRHIEEDIKRLFASAQGRS
ncbi:MAG: hypothetical protein PW788_02955 [Micavibrio sp.]|nr:hypothetical protein [Micavibrio sp.]